MGFFGEFWKALNRRRTMEKDEYKSELKRVLNLFDLTVICVGSTLGLGVYVLAGSVAYDVAGPSVTISFLVAGVASTFSALCFAELAACVPRAGSAYVYSYVMVGEFIGFTIGWNMLLEYVLGAAGIARGLTGYIDNLTGYEYRKAMSNCCRINIKYLARYPDFLSSFFVALVTVLLAWDVKISSILNTIFTTANLLTIVTVILAGLLRVDPNNWALQPSRVPEVFGTGGFLPFGAAGLFLGAAKCFFGFVGFDSVAATGEEALNPKRNIPIALVSSSLIIFITYFLLSMVLTMATPYYEIDPHAPIIQIFDRLNWEVVKWIVTIGATFAMSTSLLCALFPLPRILYAMGGDKLIFPFFAKVNPHTRTPMLATIFSGIITGIMTLFFSIEHLIDMMSIGTLMAYAVVSVCIILLRYEEDNMEIVPFTCGNILRQLFNFNRIKQPTTLSRDLAVICICLFMIFSAIWCFLATFYNLIETAADALPSETIIILCVLATMIMLCIIIIFCQPQTQSLDLFFRVPLVPFIPCMGIFINVYLVFQLNAVTWVRYVVWLGIGYMIYFSYGVWNSAEIERSKQAKQDEKKQPVEPEERRNINGKKG